MSEHAKIMLDYMTHSIPVLVEWAYYQLFHNEAERVVFHAMLALAED